MPESCKSKTLENNPKTPTSSPSLPYPLVYETPIIELNKHTVGDTDCSLKEEVILQSIEVYCMQWLFWVIYLN